MSERLTAFPPVAASDARALILGSMPSVASLQEGFYYGHPRNAFWRILAESFDCPIPDSVGEKKQLILAHRLALWDALSACEREGSLDSAIRRPELNDFAGLFERCPGIRLVLQGSFPAVAGKNNTPSNTQLFRFNLELAALCAQTGMVYLDPAYALRTGEGALRDDYCLDRMSYGTHLNDAGCQAWIDFLMQYVPE